MSVDPVGTEGLALFEGAVGHVPPPPTGPPADIPTEREGDYIAYRTWRATDDGKRAWTWIKNRALEAVHRGEKRVSPRTLVGACRDALRVKINDHFSPWIADDLVHDWPVLRDVIERRKRKLPCAR